MRRLLNMWDPIEQKIIDIIDSKRDEIIAFGDDIWHHAELGYKEVRTVGKYTEWMEKLGLETEQGWAITGAKTYLNPKGTTEGPTLAVMGEMDALPIPNNPDSYQGNAHCCGHNAQITGVVGAALALTDPEVKAALGGNICFMAVPAEEFVDITYKSNLMKEGKLHYGGGKCELIRVGAMDDIDIALGHHTSTSQMGIMNGTSNGFINKTVTFTGRSAHAAGMPHEGVDALNAATIAMVNAAFQQESYRDEDSVRVHGFVQEGGTAVNVIADHVVMQWCTRGKTPEAYKDASDKLDRSLKAAAVATGCGLHIESMAGYMSEVSNPHIEVIKSVLDDIAAEGKYTEIKIDEGHSTGSDDYGDISCLMPLVHFSTGGAAGAVHNPTFHFEDQYLAYVVTSKIFALTAYRLMKDGAKAAKENIADYKPVFTKEEYIAFQDSMQTSFDMPMDPLPIVGKK